MRVIEVKSVYYHSRLNLVEGRLRGFISDTVEADKYFLVFGKEGLPIGGFAVSYSGWLLGLFTIKRGVGNELVTLALKTAKKLLQPTQRLRLFCTGEFLRKMYRDKGFEVYDISEWDERATPNVWSTKEFGTPLIYYMELK